MSLAIETIDPSRVHGRVISALEFGLRKLVLSLERPADGAGRINMYMFSDRTDGTPRWRFVVAANSALARELADALRQAADEADAGERCAT